MIQVQPLILQFFLEDTIPIFGNKKVGLVRFDSIFFQKDILDYLKQKVLNYIVNVRFTHPIQQLINKQDLWLEVDDGIEICDKTYQANSWENERRIVIVRQKIASRPNATGRTLILFEKDELHRNYRYSSYITNVEYTATDVWRKYR